MTRFFSLGKVSLSALGVFFAFILIEAGLRLAGFAVLSLQEYRNLQSMRHAGTYRIMCVGESTTQRQYPQQLEEILNQRSNGIKFSVIDKGVAGITSAGILSALEAHLDAYRPDMVIVMMGINDAGPQMPFESDPAPKIARFFRSWRIYKLARLLRLRIAPQKPPAKQPGSLPTEESLKKAIALDPRNPNLSLTLGRLYHEWGRHAEAEELLRKAIALDPQNSDSHLALGQLYHDRARHAEAEELLRKAIALDPRNSDSYASLGRLYHDQDRYAEAEDSLRAAIMLAPQNPHPYFFLGRLYYSQRRYAEAEDWLKKAAGRGPRIPNIYLILGRLYLEQERFPEARDALETAVKLNPRGSREYADLVQLYLDQGMLARAEEAVKEGIARNPKDDWLFGALSVIYGEAGKPALQAEYAEKADSARLTYYRQVTVDNHRRLKEILDRRGVRLVCMQYPMRSVEPLKTIFRGDDERIVFVDNEGIFRDAVSKEGYQALFKDIYGGDFGHCTRRGNRLLAENIADTILREVFHR